MTDHKDCLGYNILHERQESQARELMHLKEWSNEKDLEIEKQFQALQESQHLMEKHYDKRMDNFEEKLDRVAHSQHETAIEVKQITKNLTSVSNWVKWFVRVVGAFIIVSGIGWLLNFFLGK